MNDWRRENGSSPEARVPVCWSVVQDFRRSSACIKITKRGTKKSGKDDVGSAWAKARLAQCKQFQTQRQLAQGAHNTRGAGSTVLRPLHLEAVAWWDEHHKKTLLGHVKKQEARVSRDPVTNVVCTPVEKGGTGVFPPTKPVTTVKYQKEARACFGLFFFHLKKTLKTPIQWKSLQRKNQNGKQVSSIKIKRLKG